jgi:uncharacterized protein
MRKRVRKKRRFGEFAEYGLLVNVTPAASLASADREALLDQFIDEAIERNDLCCGGGGGPTWEFFVTSNARRASVSEPQRLSLEAWLTSNAAVEAFTLSPPIDAWHGEF